MKKLIPLAGLLPLLLPTYSLANETCFVPTFGDLPPIDDSSVSVRYKEKDPFTGEYCVDGNFQYNITINGRTGPWISAILSDINSSELDVSENVTLLTFNFDELANGISGVNDTDLQNALLNIRYSNPSVVFSQSETSNYFPRGAALQWQVAFSGFFSPWQNITVEPNSVSENTMEIYLVEKNDDIDMNTQRAAFATKTILLDAIPTPFTILQNSINDLLIEIRYGQGQLDTALNINSSFALPIDTSVQYSLEISDLIGPWLRLEPDSDLLIELYNKKAFRDDDGNWQPSGQLDLVEVDLNAADVDNQDYQDTTNDLGLVNIRYSSLPKLENGALFWSPVGKTFQWNYETGGTQGGWRSHETGEDGDLKLRNRDFCWVDIRSRDINGEPTESFSEEYTVNIRYRDDLQALEEGAYFLWPKDKAFQWQVKTANGAMGPWLSKKGCGDLTVREGKQIQPMTITYDSTFQASSRASSDLRYLTPSSVANDGTVVWLPVGYSLQTKPDFGNSINASWQRVDIKAGSKNELVWSLNGQLTTK